MLWVSVLGPLEAYRHEQPLHVPSGKASELLVRLALDAGDLVSAERLIEDLWAAEAPNTQRNTLQSKVAMLRRSLADPGSVKARQGGYVLDLERNQVDALLVLDQLAEATRLVEGPDDVGAARLAASAVQLFHGPILPHAGDGPWVAAHRSRLDQARLELFEILYAARLQLGRAGEVAADIQSALDLYPFSEVLWELLITALYRAGRQPEALANHRRVRALFVEEFGLEPGPGLLELEGRILTHDPSLRGSGQPLVRSHRAGNLPSITADLVGRQHEQAEVAGLLRHERLVVIVGPGGVGKTALALGVGQQLQAGEAPDTVWIARLEGALTTQDVYDVLVAALDGPTGVEAMFHRLQDARAVMILDNCEHVVDAAAELAVRLLDISPRIRVLCTSQVALDVVGERTYELAPLSIDDASELFTRRASRGGRPAPGVDDPARVNELCRHLDGLPLAIELAAARSRTLSLDEISRRLGDRFRILADPTSRKPERRRSLRATIGWSYDLLFPDDQRGLWALATFADGAPLDAFSAVLEALGVPAPACVDVLGRLAARSLLVVDDQRWSTRYRLLDSIRAFALAAVAEAGLADDAAAAHARWFAGAADASTDGVRSAQQASFLAVARAERANIETALTWCVTHDPAMALRIATGFGWAWVVLGDSRGAQRLLSALDSVAESAAAGERAQGLLLAAWIEASTERLELASDHVATAAALASEDGDPDLQARCLYYLAYVVSHRGHFAQALELTTRCGDLYDALDRPWDQAANALFEARAALSAGDHARSMQGVAHVLSWLTKVDDPWLHVRGVAVRGELARMESRYDDAVVHLREAVATSGRLGFQQTEAYQTTILGRALCQAGEVDEGLDVLDLAIEKARHVGDLRLAALARIHLGRAARADGQGGRARAALEAATAWYRAAGGGEHATIGESLLAALDAEEGLADAGHRLESVLDAARREDDAAAEVFALDALARLQHDAGRHARARELLDAADRKASSAQNLVTDHERVDAFSLRSRAEDRSSAG